ncbi:MAG: hypothetical protein WA634_09590 [Silvibacterium sp.]
MEAGLESLVRGTPPDPARTAQDEAMASDLRCRVCELETENARLRLLVGEILVTNQQLREEMRAAMAAALL